MGYREELNAANKAGKSLEERWALRAKVREKYGMGPEKRKRGGVAGAYDRNKEWVKPLAQVAAGMTPLGWVGGAALGAGIGGFDREGKGGIGFDTGGALKGGVQGAALGSLGQFGAGKLGIQGAGSKIPGMLGGPAKVAGAPGTPAGTAAATAAKPSLASRVGTFMKDNPNAVGGALTAGGQFAQAGADRSVAKGNQAIAQQQLDFEREQYDAEQQARKKRSAIAQQLYNQIQGRMSWNRPQQGGM